MVPVPLLLIIISYIFGFYFGTQGTRDVIDRPLFWSEHPHLLFLVSILTGWLLSFYATYLGFLAMGWWYALLLLLLRFVIFPTFFNNHFLRLLKRFHT
jgi:hypothetical protein